ncbi:thioredoxin domain-containing protein, partial [Escherichia coli]|nr:thioredoxin domain-containing protein [Escherichia coli]
MTVFTLPDGRTFHAGTYFPPRQRGRVPSFMQVLTAVTEAYTQRREGVEQQAAALAEHLVELSRGQHQMRKFSADPATVQDGNQAEGQALDVAVHQW